MNIKRIIVDKKDGCVACPFCVRVNNYMRDYYECRVTAREVFDCTGMQYREYIEKFEEIGTPEWCPLEVEEVCEWHGEYGGYDEHGDMIFFARKTGCSDSHIQKVSVVDYTYCPNCGRKIKYVEVE